MRNLQLIFAVWALGLSAAWAETSSPPSVCRADDGAQVDFQACADVAKHGSPERALALINLGTQAVLKQDYQTAVRLYDEAAPRDGSKLFSDGRFHASRAYAYDRVGRNAEALADAKVALAVMRGQSFDGVQSSPEVNDPEVLFAYILPILKRAGDVEYAAAASAYQALPARDWISYANRAAVLIEIEDFNGATVANEAALALEPNHPAVLNNACYLATRSGRPAEGLPFCERAIAAAPEVAAVQHSYAATLASLGRCWEAADRSAQARRLDPVSTSYQQPLACASS